MTLNLSVMKLPIVVIISLTLCFVGALAQKINDKEYDFLGPLHFKNGKASVIVKATYLSFTETNNPDIIGQLYKKKVLDGKKYANIDYKGEGWRSWHRY
jgi:hypothetical protein